MAKSSRSARHAKLVAMSSKGSSRKKGRRVSYDPNRGLGDTSLPIRYEDTRAPFQPT